VNNRAFAAKEMGEAVRLYTMALEKLPSDAEHNHARSVFYANRAACYLHQKEYELVIDDCTSSIEQAPRYVKAYTRRAQAYEALDDLETALQGRCMDGSFVTLFDGLCWGVARVTIVARFPGHPLAKATQVNAVGVWML
jgi:stress-induced-phosphoprotein 1